MDINQNCLDVHEAKIKSKTSAAPHRQQLLAVSYVNRPSLVTQKCIQIYNAFLPQLKTNSILFSILKKTVVKYSRIFTK